MGLLVCLGLAGCGYHLASRSAAVPVAAPGLCYRLDHTAKGQNTAYIDQQIRTALVSAFAAHPFAQCKASNLTVPVRIASFSTSSATQSYDAGLTRLSDIYKLTVSWQAGDQRIESFVIVSRTTGPHSSSLTQQEQVGIAHWQQLAQQNVEQLAGQLQAWQTDWYAGSVS